MRTVEILIEQSLHGLSMAREMCGPVNTPQFDALDGSVKALKVVKQTSTVANLNICFYFQVHVLITMCLENSALVAVPQLPPGPPTPSLVAVVGAPSTSTWTTCAHSCYPSFSIFKLLKCSANHLSTSCRLGQRLCSLDAYLQTPSLN